jgi:hypothetical protein
VEQRLAVAFARRHACELEQSRHEVDRAHLLSYDTRLQPTGGGEDERHLHDLVVERRSVHVVHALNLLLRREALAPRLAVVAQERERGVLAQTKALELFEHAGDELLRLALDGLAIRLACGFERGGRVALDAREDLLLGTQPVGSLRVEDEVRHVRRPVVEEEEERLVALLA